MRPQNKIVASEFKAKLKQITNNHPSQSIKLNQFLTLLLTNNIRLYSRAQLSKITKFFDNPLKIAKIIVPLSYFQLECVQENNKRKSFIIKISSRIQHSFVYQSNQEQHSSDKCLSTLTKILKSHYGSEKNWFKVLGGLTISITIDKRTFKTQIQKLLRNTNHIGCSHKLVKLFTENQKNNTIEWSYFMKIIHQSNHSSPRKISQHIRCKTADFETQNQTKIYDPILSKTQRITTEHQLVVQNFKKPFLTGKFWSHVHKETQFQLLSSISVQSKRSFLFKKECSIHRRQRSLKKNDKNSLSLLKNRTEPSIKIQKI